MTAAVSVRDAFRIYGDGPRASVALQGLTVDIASGEVVVLLGPSGSGKTTLLRMVAGLDRLSAGSVHAFGVDVGRLTRKQLVDFRARQLGFLDQHYTRALSPELGIRQAVSLQLTLRGAATADAKRAADELLERIGLRHRGDDRPRTLSGGEQQRVAVCAAVAHRPQLLLVDEPAGELDAESAAAVYGLLADVTRAAGASALVVSHDAAAATIADRLVHVRDGRVVEEAAPGEVPELVVSRGGWIRLPGSGPGRVTVERGGRVERHELRAGEPAADGPRPSEAPTAAGEVVAELRGVDKAYGDRTVLERFELTVLRGRLVAVVGRSGTGKTTLLHLLAGLLRPTAGEVVFDGELLNGRSRTALAALRREGIGVVTQEPGLVPHLSARENVMLGLGLRRLSGAGERADEALGAVGLTELRSRRAATLSAGERQRVAIARALAVNAPLLLADEPTARLDEENARAVGDLLARAARERRLAVVCATHDQVLIERADEVVHLESPSSG
ncbi:MAG: ATP-binding cassette domain-containing protein [Gaiellaceae bacterium]